MFFFYVHLHRCYLKIPSLTYTNKYVPNICVVDCTVTTPTVNLQSLVEYEVTSSNLVLFLKGIARDFVRGVFDTIPVGDRDENVKVSFANC